MKDLKVKIKLIYFPFLLASIGTIIIYNLIRWVITIKFGVPIRDELVNFWLPFFIPWIPVLIWLRRRIKALNIFNDRIQFWYQFAAVIAIAVPLIISQTYLENSTSEVKEVYSPKQIKKYPEKNFFDIEDFKTDSKTVSYHFRSHTSGRYNTTLDYELYFVCPFKNVSTIWFGADYSEDISNSLNKDEKELKYKEFLNRALNEFENYSFNNVKYFEKLDQSFEKDYYLKAIGRKYPSKELKNQKILVPRYEDFYNKQEGRLNLIFISFFVGAFVILIMIAIPGIDHEEIEKLKSGKSLEQDDLAEIFDYLDPTGNNKATAFLLLINILAFIITVFSGLHIFYPSPNELLEIGGNRRQDVLNGEVWRLITSIFIHAGVGHLFMNLVGLGIGCSLLEHVIGRLKLILGFIFSGIMASISSIIWHHNTVSVGASGAIFGLFGIILAFTLFKIYSYQMRKITFVLIIIYVCLSLFVGLFGGIDNAAHIGGLISGFLIGWYFTLINRNELIENAR